MGKKTGKHQEPSIRANLRTDLLQGVRSFAQEESLTESEALCVLIAYALDNKADISMRMAQEFAASSSVDQAQPPEHVPIKHEWLPPGRTHCSASRGQFAPRSELSDAKSNQVQ